MLAEVGGKKRP